MSDDELRHFRPPDDDLEARRIRANARAALFGDGERITLGRFALLDRLGAGAMGVVYSAWDSELERRVALKLVRPERVADGPSRERLLAEARTAAKVSHPSVVTVYDAGRESDQVWVAMEYVPGTTLGAWLEQDRDWRQIVDIGAQIASGLQAAHERGVLHRDVKPDNILISDHPPYRARVADFGLAIHGPVADGVSAGGSGTPAYMSPEQRRGAPLTAASDQYSLGLLLREALGNAPVWVKAVVERAVQEDPGARFPSCADLARALRTDPRTRYRRVIGAAALVAVGAVAVLLLNQRPVPCANVGDGISGTWPGQRAALAARFDALKAGWAPTVARQVESLLNRWADGLQLRARSSCESTVVAQTQSAELHDLTMRCVERIRLRGDALVKALVSDSGEDSARRSVRAVGNLPSAEQCSDPASLRRAMPLPDETEVREQVASLERIVAKRRASLELALKPEDTLPNTVTQAEEVNWPPLLARVRWIEGYSAELAGDADLAAERFERALWSAVSLREDLLAAESAARLVWVVGYLKREFDQATQWLQVADALVTASGDNRLRARLTDYRGVFAFFRGELEDAIQLHREALNILGEVSDRDPMSLGISVNLGAALIQSERLDEAETLYRELIQRASEALGASHPMVGSLYQNYATAATQRGNTAEAQRGFERALAIKEASLGPEHPALISTLANLSSVVAVLGELDAALGYGDRAMTIAFARDETNVRGFITLLNRIYSTLGVRDSIALSASEHLTRLSAAHFQSGDVDALAVRILRGAALASSGQKTAALRSLASVPRHARFAELLEEDRFEFHYARSLVTDGSTSRQALAAAAEVYRPWLYSPQRRERIEARFRDAGVAFGETNDTPSQE